MTDETIPIEANLEHAISYTKGCYIGQEVIARLEARGHEQ
jgi:folate-binding protein YgfZ